MIIALGVTAVIALVWRYGTKWGRNPESRAAGIAALPDLLVGVGMLFVIYVVVALVVVLILNR